MHLTLCNPLLNEPSVTRLMELHGFDVKGVVDGGAALSALKRSYDEDASPFDVCILDMQVRACASHAPRVSCPKIERASRARRCHA